MNTALRRILHPLKPSFWREQLAAQRRKRMMLEFYRPFIKPGDVCFDVGANLGNRTAVFLELGATVVAVEPQQTCIIELQRQFSENPKFILVPEALGAQPGEAEMRIASETTISSMSQSWIDKVRASGRFATYDWQQSTIVPVTTLEVLIRKFGVPDFMKIDVEGFEYEVMQGLHRAVRVLSLEFVPEALENTANSLRRLSELGSIECNYSLGETMILVSTSWLTADELMHALAALPEKTVFGDVYVRFLDHKSHEGNGA
jgi:FkbM family methyltransferase